MYDQTELAVKIAELHPEIVLGGIEVSVHFDAEKDGWMVRLQKGIREVDYYLDWHEAGQCLAGTPSAPLGLAVTRFLAELAKKEG